MKKLTSVLAGFAIAACALAELSKYKDWDKTAEAYFLTPDERAEWKKVATDEDAEKFIALYWAKRDPTPGTPQNEFRDEVGRRIAAADQQFKMPRYKRGADSVRGRLLVVLGTPSRAAQQQLAAEAPPPPQEGGFQPAPAGVGGGESEESLSIWTYDKDKLAAFGLPELRARVLLDQRRGADSLQNASEVEKVLATVAQKSIVNPNATAAEASAAAPKAVAPAVPAGPAATGSATAPPATAPATGKAPAAPASSAAPAAAAAPAPATMPLPAAVKSALESFDPKSGGDASFWYGTFRTASGDPFLAMQFYLPSDKPALTASAPLKFGGVVKNEAGQEVGSYWEPATLSEVAEGTRKDRVYDRSVVLPPGNYKGKFGLFAAEGEPPVAGSTVAFQLPVKSSDFEVSPLLLSNGIVPLTKRPGPADPFVFGTDKPMRVDPKGDHRFSKQDSLWYFYAVGNPAVPAAPADAGAAPAAPAKPRVMTRINVQRDGRDAFAPFTGPAELQPVGEAYYAAGSEIPLASFEPGYYTFLVKVRDLNAAPGSAANKGIDRQEDFVVLMPDGSPPPKKAAAPAPAPTPKKKTS